MAGFEPWLCCRCQYCMTMAMLAAPHPFFSCLIKGTSSHTPGLCACKTMPQRHNSIIASLCGTQDVMKIRSADCDNNEHEHRDRQNDPDQITLAQIPGGEICLRFVRAGGKLGEFFIVQRGQGGLDLPRIDRRRLHGFFGGWSEEQFLDRFQVLLARLRRGNGFFVQIGGTDPVVLRYHVRGEKEGQGQDGGNQVSTGLPDLQLHNRAPQCSVPARLKVYMNAWAALNTHEGIEVQENEVYMRRVAPKRRSQINKS